MFVSSLSGKTDAGRRDLVERLARHHCFVCHAGDADLALIETLPSYVLRWVTSGGARVTVDGQTGKLQTDQYLISNPMQHVQFERVSAETRVLIISITVARLREIHRAMRDSAQRIFHDDSAVSQWPVRFHVRGRTRPDSVSPLLDDLLKVVELGVRDNRWLEEQYGVLAERLLFDEYRQQRRGRSLHRSGALEERLRKAKQHMDKHFDESLSLTDLARIASVSPHHFLRSFKKVFATTPHRYLVDMRLRRARHLLHSTDLSVCEIGARIGFASANGFHSAFRRKYHCSPAACRTTRPNPKPANAPSSSSNDGVVVPIPGFVTAD